MDDAEFLIHLHQYSRHPLRSAYNSTMSQDPKEVWRKLQQTMNTAQQKGRGSLPGGPRNLFGAAGGIILLATGAVVINNALFNGKRTVSYRLKQ